MTTFTQAVANQTTRTTNGMKAFKDSSNALTDLFFKVGASRGKDIVPAFVKAYVEDPNLALRIALWTRDIRGGAGERDLFRNILKYLEVNDPDAAEKVLPKIPELGRFDDLFSFQTPRLKNRAYALLGDALRAGNGLAAKWCPRKGPVANELRTFFEMSPRNYRKTLVNLTKVVEQQMCSNDWDNINFSHVPSLASARYKKAFNRHTKKFAEYVSALVKGDPSVKVNADAVYPYDVLKGVYHANYNKTELEHIVAQWAALPNYVGDANILPLVDVSGSMTCSVGGNPTGNLTCLDVAVSIGLYLAEKNQGKFKDTFLTFSSKSELITLTGDIVQKMQQMNRSHWEMSTNLHSAFNKILDVAVENSVPQEEMPEILLILSDMQMDYCSRFDNTAYQMIQRKYEEAGYQAPAIVFWNLNAFDNVPVKAHASGAALVSGFSPAIMKAILSADMSEFTPYSIMLKTIMNERYDI